MVLSAVETASSSAVAAKLFRGLGDPTRLALLLRLLQGERRVSDLVADLNGSQPNISGHLACLKDCGLVVDRPGDRRQVFYRIAHPELLELLAVSERLLEATGSRLELCTNYADAGTQSASSGRRGRR